MLVSSRSFGEYAAMFALGDVELSGSVLDCSAGASGFTATAARRGARAVALDPAYAVARTELPVLARTDLGRGAAIAAAHPDAFTWEWYGDPAHRDRLRQQALADFVTDVVTHPHRYVAGALPRLPFADRSFDLGLCSHLLFTWADELGLDWHRAALLDLARVAREVRVFPLVVQGTGGPVPFWDELMTDLAAAGLRIATRDVPYRFQRTATQMLVVSGT